VEFAELGEFMDLPMRTYSSGMYGRLAFSVAVNMDPDILLIDEAMSVGDARFRRKSVASVLMSAAVSWAEEHDCELVLTTAPASSRDAHRFLTRLGFGQVAVVRGAQTSALRSKFVGMATSSKGTGRLIAVRRTLRRRQRTADLAFLTSEPGVPES